MRNARKAPWHLANGVMTQAAECVAASNPRPRPDGTVRNGHHHGASKDWTSVRKAVQILVRSTAAYQAEVAWWSTTTLADA